MVGYSHVFEFEQDFAGSLRCIPMAVRFKLDACGVKLSLRQWARLSREDRAKLLELPCEDDQHSEDYRRTLIGLVQQRTGEQPAALTEAPDPEWSDPRHVPDAVSHLAASLHLPSLSTAQWAALDPLQRFALSKLSRSRHDQTNFPSAMREFGLSG